MSSCTSLSRAQGQCSETPAPFCSGLPGGCAGACEHGSSICSSEQQPNSSSSLSSMSSEASFETTTLRFPNQRCLTYTGPDVHTDLPLLFSRANIRSVLDWMMDARDCRVSCIVCTAAVQAWRLECEQFVRPLIVKWARPARVTGAASQFGAEARAATAFTRPNPLMCHPMDIDLSFLGATTISVDAGDSLEQLLKEGGAWTSNNASERLQLATQVAAGLMLARTELDNVCPEKGGPQMHRDIKAGNVCVRMVGDRLLPTLIGFGGYTRQDKLDYHGVTSLNALDSQLAALDPTGQFAVAEHPELARYMTHHTVDMYQTALCFMQIVGGGLPEVLRPESYDNETMCSKVCQAVREFDWSSSPQVKVLPEAAQKFVLSCLSRDVNSRPQTGAEALQQHPFLAAAAQKVALAAEAAAEEWQAAHEQLKTILYDENSMESLLDALDACTDSSDVHTDSPADSSMVASSPDSSSSSNCDNSCCNISAACSSVLSSTATDPCSQEACALEVCIVLQSDSNNSTQQPLPANPPPPSPGSMVQLNRSSDDGSEQVPLASPPSPSTPDQQMGAANRVSSAGSSVVRALCGIARKLRGGGSSCLAILRPSGLAILRPILRPGGRRKTHTPTTNSSRAVLVSSNGGGGSSSSAGSPSIGGTCVSATPSPAVKGCRGLCSHLQQAGFQLCRRVGRVLKPAVQVQHSISLGLPFEVTLHWG